MDKKNTKMNKKILVSFLLIASVLFLATVVSATLDITADGALNIDEVSVDGIYASGVDDISVTAGETITIKVYFTVDANEELSDVVFNVELGDSEVEVEKATIVADDQSSSDKVVLNIKVPYDFDDDELHKDETLEITIEYEDDNGDDFEATAEVELEIKRPDYNVEIKPIHVPSSVEAGETFSVDVIVENNGYNDLDDLYITASISALGVEETFYIGDLTDVVEDDESSVHKRITLEVPYDAEAGEYVLEIAVSNEDANVVKTKVVVTENSLPNQVIKTENGLIIINPTDKVAVYTVVAESPASVSQSTVVIEDGSSKEVTVTANTDSEFSVSVFSATGELIDTVNFSGSAQNNEVELTNPVFMLTVILAVVFLVLLVVLIVLITKKPQKAEEFGESYY